MDEVIAEWVNNVFREVWMRKEQTIEDVGIVPQNVGQTYCVRLYSCQTI